MTQLVNQNTLIGGQRIAYGVYGTGEPVVLIHGTPFYSHIWRNLLPELMQSDCQVYLYDLLGFGHSERPRDPAVDTSVSAQLPILIELLDYWGLDDAHIVAHDIGGAIAQQLGILHPERIRSLTIIDCVSFDSWPSTRTRKQMAAGLDKLIEASDQEHRKHFTEWLLTATHKPDKLRAGPLNAYLEMISGTLGQASLFQHQVRHYDPEHTAKLVDRYADLGSLPLQFIWGADDAWQVTDWAHRLHETIPGSLLHVLEDCGHLAMEDQPEQVAGLVIEHISAHRAANG